MQKSPVLIHVPHSQTFIPPCEKKLFLKEELSDELLKMTDLYTDELFDCGEDMLVFPVSRLVCDVERFRDDVDEPMAAKGMGLAYTKCADGAPLRHVSPQKRADIVSRYYDVHHANLTKAVNEKLCLFGRCLIIDAHSFSAVPLPYEDCALRPDLCIGTDAFHTPKNVENACVEFLQKRGYEAMINKPFSGTMVPLEFLNKDSRVSSVMIEVNRRLYMTPDGKKSASFEKLKNVLASLVSELAFNLNNL